MASYTQATTNPAFFEVPTFDAPSEFLYTIQRQKQQDFDKGIQATRAEYQSMANLPVSSQYGLAKRDAYMQQASEDLRKVAGADFSLDENVAASKAVYKPLTSDPDILFDLGQSRKAQQQTGLMDRLRTSKDEKDRAQYWETGREYVDQSIKKLQSARTAEELRSSSVRDYVPYTDIIGKLNKAAADLKLKISLDHVTGGYIVTKENGEDAHLPFYLFAQSQLDVKEREVLRVLGTVEADRSIKLETLRNGGDEVAARQKLAGQAITERFTDLTRQVEENNKALAKLKLKRDEIKAGNGNKIDDNIKERLFEIDDKIDMIGAKNTTIDQRIRDLGFNKFQDQYIKNAQYNTTLSYYQNDLSIPYTESAARNITTNWAAGLATATTGLTIKSDPNFGKAIDLQIEEIKANAKLAEEQGKATAAATGGSTSKSGTKKEKEEEPDYINEPLQLDNNPFGRENMSAYELFQNTKKSYENDLYSKGTDFIQDALGLDADFLTKLADNMKKGAANESIKGVSRFRLEDDPSMQKGLQQIGEMHQRGEISGNANYADLFNDLVKRAKQVTEEKLKNPPDDVSTLANIVRLSKEVEANLNAFKVLKDDELKIKSSVLSSGKYKELQNDKGDVMTKNEFLEKVVGTSNKEDFKYGTFDQIQDPVKREEVKAVVREFGIKQNPGWIFDAVGKLYDKRISKFNEDFSTFINVEKPQFFSRMPMQSGQIGFVYPYQEWSTRKNPESGEKEIGEIALKRAFQDANLTDETKVLNLDRLGNKKQTMALVNYIQGSLESDITPDIGRVYTVQVGSDGKSPSVIFRPSVGFLKQFVEKGNPLEAPVLEKIARNGIEIAADIPEVQENKPSLVGRLIDIDKSYEVLPELKQEGFGATIEKMTNGRGYRILFDYKTIDPSGKEIIEVRKDLSGGVNIPEQRLDLLSRTVINDILNNYIKYKRQKKAVEGQNIPKPVISEEEYQKQRQLR